MFQIIFDGITNIFRIILDLIPIYPQFYYGLIPLLSMEDITIAMEKGVFPKLNQLAPAFTYCLLLSLARYILQHYVVNHFSLWCMQIKPSKFKANPKIDEALPYKRKLVYEPAIIAVKAKQLNLSVPEIEKYLRRRIYSQVTQRKIIKFVEAFWRATFYGCFTYLGYITLFTPKPVSWVLNTNNFWDEWPNHPLIPSILFYYQIELGCYFHQLLWTDVTHSDALEMTTHHFVTIALVVISFLTNFYRIGTVILIIHDISDVFLESAKVFNYTSKAPANRWMKTTIVDGLFALFAITFFITRLVIYPYFVLRSVYTEGYVAFNGFSFYGSYIFTFLLFALQGLHIFWFYLIGKMIVSLMLGQMEGDVRSDEEDEEEEQQVLAQPKVDGSDDKSGNNKKKD